MLDYGDKNLIMKQIENAYQNWKKETPADFSLKDLERFTRKGLTEKLANKLNNLSR
jgi:hypothetical protein